MNPEDFLTPLTILVINDLGLPMPDGSDLSDTFEGFVAKGIKKAKNEQEE